VIEFIIEIRIEFWLQDMFKNREFALFFGLERFRIVKDFSVPVTKDICREPAIKPDQSCLEAGGEDRFHQSLSRFEILPAYWHFVFVGEFKQGGNIDRQVRRSVGEWYPH